MAYCAAWAAVVCLAAYWTGSLHADTTPYSVKTAVGLVAKNRMIVSDPASPTYDFGPRLSSNETPITRVFVLQNKTGHALTIDLVRPSCGCISAAIDLPRSRMPYALGPGKSVPILVTLEPEASASGPLEKDVSFFVQGQTRPATVLMLKGTLLPAPQSV